jgi:UDPglucose 6-dehydrogenase
MVKHASNSFLSTSISFINEMADLCEVVGADAAKVSHILKLDQRIGKQAFLNPGLGFAGGTLGREIRALQKLGAMHRVPTPLIDAVWQINGQRPQLVGRRLSAILGNLEGRRIGILGLTYKPGTSTLRRAISLDIVRDLIRRGAKVKAFDPLANLAEVPDLPPMQLCADPYQVAQDCSALVLITEWPDISSLDLPRLRRNMGGNVFLDTRNLLDPARMAEAGFRYFGIGR